MITSFSYEYSWLSNFAPVDIEYQGIVYPSVEHAYVAAKTTCPNTRKLISELFSAGQAKRFGRDRLNLRDGWEDIKVDTMLELCRLKFSQEPYKSLLIETGDTELIEGNTWGDDFWGMIPHDNGTAFRGLNTLGEILMQIRKELSASH